MKGTIDPGKVSIRSIQQKDDLKLGAIIRGCFLDYDAAQEGTVFADKIIDQLSVSFDRDRSAYFVLDMEGEVLGGAGIQPLKGGEQHICELQKMYIKKEARGLGLGRALMEKCISFAREQNYSICYLESLPELKDALRLYERSGFTYIKNRLGATGYYGCTLYMTIEL